MAWCEKHAQSFPDDRKCPDCWHEMDEHGPTREEIINSAFEFIQRNTGPREMTDHAQIDHMIEVLQGYKEGKAIQYQPALGYTPQFEETQIKQDCPEHHKFNFRDFKYRIKPETGKARLIKELKQILPRPGAMLMVSAESINGLTGPLKKLTDAIEDGQFDDFLGEG